jgi:hypothetical protein
MSKSTKGIRKLIHTDIASTDATYVLSYLSLRKAENCFSCGAITSEL